MNTSHLRRVRRLFMVPGVPTVTARHNMRQWVVSIRHLGDKWLIAKPVQRTNINT